MTEYLAERDDHAPLDQRRIPDGTSGASRRARQSQIHVSKLGERGRTERRQVGTDVGVLRSRAMRRFLPRKDNCKYGDERHDREECDEHPRALRRLTSARHVEQFEEPSHYSEG